LIRRERLRPRRLHEQLMFLKYKMKFHYRRFRRLKFQGLFGLRYCGLRHRRLLHSEYSKLNRRHYYLGMDLQEEYYLFLQHEYLDPLVQNLRQRLILQAFHLHRYCIRLRRHRM
jgi:hypothetical protein